MGIEVISIFIQNTLLIKSFVILKSNRKLLNNWFKAILIILYFFFLKKEYKFS